MAEGESISVERARIKNSLFAKLGDIWLDDVNKVKAMQRAAVAGEYNLPVADPWASPFPGSRVTIVNNNEPAAAPQSPAVPPAGPPTASGAVAEAVRSVSPLALKPLSGLAKVAIGAALASGMGGLGVAGATLWNLLHQQETQPADTDTAIQYDLELIPETKGE